MTFTVNICKGVESKLLVKICDGSELNCAECKRNGLDWLLNAMD